MFFLLFEGLYTIAKWDGVFEWSWKADTHTHTHTHRQMEICVPFEGWWFFFFVFELIWLTNLLLCVLPHWLLWAERDQDMFFLLFRRIVYDRLSRFENSQCDEIFRVELNDTHTQQRERRRCVPFEGFYTTYLSSCFLFEPILLLIELILSIYHDILLR